MLIGFMGPDDTNKAEVRKEVRSFTDIVPLKDVIDQAIPEGTAFTDESLRRLLDVHIEQLNQVRSVTSHYLVTLTPADIYAVMTTFVKNNNEYKEQFEADAKKAMEKFNALFVFENAEDDHPAIREMFEALMDTCRRWDLEVTMVSGDTPRDQAEFVGLACGIPLA